jgi:hypothetical protein
MHEEYVKVSFPTHRHVQVDGQPAGFTNKTFQVEAGEHVFDLGDPKNYMPERHVLSVNGTMPDEPQLIAFVLKP